MISPFDTHPAIFNRKDGSVLTISRNGVLCKDKTARSLVTSTLTT